MDPSAPEPRGTHPRATDHAPSAGAGRKLVLILVGLIVVAALAAIPPAYRTTVRWRANTLVKQAEELLRQEAFPEAISRLESALKVDASCPEALRSLGGIYARFEIPAALPLYRALVNGPGHTEEDVQNYIQMALRLQRFDLVEGELSRLLASPKISVQTHILATEFFYRLGDFPRALGFANETRRLEATNATHQLRAARILLQMPAPEKKAQGLALLRSLSSLTPLQRLDALQMLTASPGLPRNETARALEALGDPADPSSAEYFLRATLRLRLDPANGEKIIQETIDRARGATPVFQSDLCVWLIQHGQQDRILAAYTVDEAMKSPAVLTNYLQALIHKNAWPEVQKLATASLPLDPWILEGFRALAAQNLNQGALAEEHWRRAFETAGASPARLRALGDLAFAQGADTAAIKAFTLLGEDKLHRGIGFLRLARVHQKRRDADALRSVMQSWAAGSDHPLPEQTYCYLSALLGKDVEAALPRARALYDRMPQNLSYRATLAFLEFRRGNLKEAASLLSAASSNPATATAQSRLVEAVVLEASGETNRAREIAATIQGKTLLQQEQDILRRLGR